jgi:hypothetical protein
VLGHLQRIKENGDIPNFLTVALSFLSSSTFWEVTTFLVLLWVPTEQISQQLIHGRASERLTLATDLSAI